MWPVMLEDGHPPYDQRNANTTVQLVTSAVCVGQLLDVAFRRETKTAARGQLTS